MQVEAKKNEDKDEKKHRKKHHRKKSKHRTHSSSENDSEYEDAALTVEKQRESQHKGSKSDKPSSKTAHTSDEEPSERGDARRKKYYDKEYKDRRSSGAPNPKRDKSDDQQKSKKSYYDSQRKEYSSERQVESRHEKRSNFSTSNKPPRNESNRHRNPVKLSEEERAARLREMQMDAERHEEQRWKRLKKAADSDAQEAIRDHASLGRNFLDATQKSIYGAEKGGSSTIEESVRRRTHYLQGRSASDTNAFRRS